MAQFFCFFAVIRVKALIKTYLKNRTYKGHPEMKAATKFAELATKYKIYFLILPDMEDSN